MFLLYFIYLFTIISCVDSAIVPEQLPSFISESSFQIPQIKKGTDSRIGFGFSLGNHADVQIVIEIGPQKITIPYGVEYKINSSGELENKTQTSRKREKVSSRSTAKNNINNSPTRMRQQSKSKSLSARTTPSYSKTKKSSGVVNMNSFNISSIN